MKKPCAKRGCPRPSKTRGLCGTHYEAARKAGDFSSAVCSIGECARPVYARGWCRIHYRRWQDHGTPDWKTPEEIPWGTCSVKGCSEREFTKKSHLCRTHYLSAREARLARNGSTCRMRGCVLPVYVEKRRLCRVHYHRFKNTGDPATPVLRIASYPTGTVCAAEGCDRTKIEGKGLCQKHYKLEQYARNPEPYRANSRNSRERHNEATQKRDRERYARDPDSYRYWRRVRKARIRGAAETHTQEEWDALLEYLEGRCAYCFEPATTLDHIVPIARGGTNAIENIVPACQSCNSSKSDNTLDEWLGFVIRPYKPRGPYRRKAQSPSVSR